MSVGKENLLFIGALFADTAFLYPFSSSLWMQPITLGSEALIIRDEPTERLNATST